MEEEKLETVEEKSVYEKIELLRTEFLKEYSKQKVYSLIILVVFVLLMLGSFALLMTMPDKIHLVLIAALVIFVGTYLLTRLIKGSREKSIKGYVENYRHLINDYIYQDVKLESVEQMPFEKVSDEEIISMNIFEKFASLQSNDVIKAKYNEHNFLSYSAAVYDDKNSMVFYGKVYTLDLDKNVEGEMIIHLKTENGKGPYKGEHLVKTNNLLDDRFVCYTSLASETVKTLLPKATLNSIKKFESSDLFKDLTIVIKDKKVYILVSCRNDIIDVALKEKLEEEVILKQKENVDLLFKILKGIK